jgi:FkbM family methyltransferase
MDWAIPEGDTYFRKILEATPAGFELDHLEVALAYCTQFRTAVDGGAHIGTWTVALAQRFRWVYAFEPATDTYKCLLTNTEPYKNVVRSRAALGAKKGGCTVVEDPTRVGNTGSRMIELNDDPLVGTPVVTIDQFKDIAELDFLKLDLEGFEVEALRGAAETIRRCQPVIMAECKSFSPPRYGGPEAIRQALADLGYQEVGGVRNDRVFVNTA